MPEPEMPVLEKGSMVDEKWTILNKLGEGGFGAVYKCTNEEGEEYALKLEAKGCTFQVLRMEVAVLEQLQTAKNRHFCEIAGKGLNDEFYYVVMTLVGKSLQDLRKNRKDQSFTLNTTLRVGVQCLEAIEEMHRIGYLHRDIKPGNYAVGREEVGELRVVYILDFGMCRKYLEGGKIRIPRAKAAFRGTIRYASLACHKSKELSPRDDVESWFYQHIELTKGKLPWKHLDSKHEVTEWKQNMRSADHPLRKELLRGCPHEYGEILEHIEKLTYNDTPDYGLIYCTLGQIAGRYELEIEAPFDWEPGAKAAKKASERASKRTKKTDSARGVKPPPSVLANSKRGDKTAKASKRGSKRGTKG